MASNRSSDDFDDFFDTADQTTGKSNKAKKSKDRESASRERGWDSDTDSHSSRASISQHRRSANRRSRSCSSRSSASSFTDSSRSRSPKRKDRQHNDSLSRSSSATSSKSRTNSYDSATREKETTNRKAKVSHRRDSNVSVDTAHATEYDKRVSNPKSRASLRNQAWGKEAKSEKSQVRRNSTRRTSADEKKLKQGHRSNKYSQADSDSDITDVSPISSPRNNQGEFRKQPDSKPPKCISKASGVLGDPKRPKNRGTKNALELNLLEKAVSELEKQTRVQSNTHRVMFEPSRIRPEQKPNYTFSERDTYRIDQENQRLLRQIMCQMHTMDGRYMGSFSKGKKSVIPASGINRLKDHNRIEKENLALLRRLQHIKPSRGISRQEQLSAYNTTLLHGVPISATHPMTPWPAAAAAGVRHKGSESRAAGSEAEAGSLGRTRSLTSVQSAGTTTTSSSLRSGQSGRRLRSRPSSAKTAMRERPPWDDRW